VKRIHKKNVLNRIDDAINDKIDEIKEKNAEKKLNKNNLKSKKKEQFTETKKDKIIRNNDEDRLLKEVDLNEDKKFVKEVNLDDEQKKEKPKKKFIFNFKRDKKDKKHLDEEMIDSDKTKKKKNNKEKIKNNKNDSLTNKKQDKKETTLVVDDEDDNLVKEVNLEEDSEKEKTKKKFLFASNKHSNKVKKIKPEKVKKGKIKGNKQKKRPFWKKIVTFILIICIMGVLAVTAFLGYIVITAPEFNESDLVIKDQTLVYDADGNIIAKLGTQKRESITYDKLPQVLIDAIIATEDSRFFQHNGVDLFRFIKATIQQVLGQDDAGGASTLTMQTVKNRITQKGNKDEGKIEKIIRKFQDVYIAVFKVEKEYSKEEILEMYVNDNYLGGSYWGVEEASKYYFGKSATDLTLPEAAIIAGLFQLPGRYNPYINVEAATKRRNLVLKYMYDHEYITEEEKELVKKIPIESLLVGTQNEETKYQGYIDTVVAEVEDLTGENPYTVPMKIYTAMEKSIQDGINNVYNSDNTAIWRDEKVQGGVAVINVENGTIAAVGAGRNRVGERQFNYATMAYRQPGSTAKPIFDYGPGIEYNNFSSYQLFMDEPWTYTNGPAVNNWDGGYEGLITARRALQVSRNIPALKAFQQVGAKNSQKFASSLGLNVSLNSSSENYVDYGNGVDNTINEAYAIGGVAKGFTPLNMATAYACFANGGYYIEPHTVTKIIYRQTGEEKEFKYTKERVMKDSTAYIINNILESAVSGGGFDGGARIPGSHVAAKTGTSNYDDATMKAKGLPSYAINDLWTVAYTSQYSIAVWYGYKEIDNQYFNYEDSRKTRFTAAVMQYIPKDTKGWTMPSSVVASRVEMGTWPAQLPSENTPSDIIQTEYFVRGTQPTEVSERYQKLNDIKNYIVTNNDKNSATITWEFDTPKVLTKEYLTNYFNKSVFGNSKNKMVEQRLYYNEHGLGEVGFAIYKQAENGSLTLIDFVKDNKYTYTGYGNTTLVIKAEHSKFKSNASSGIKITLNLDDLDANNIKTTFPTNGVVQSKVGMYEEKGFKSITYGNVDISNDVTIIYSISSDTNVYTTPAEFETFVNTLPAGTYTITYTITYQGLNVKKTRKLILKD